MGNRARLWKPHGKPTRQYPANACRERALIHTQSSASRRGKTRFVVENYLFARTIFILLHQMYHFSTEPKSDQAACLFHVEHRPP